jgi:hypothetical protein
MTKSPTPDSKTTKQTVNQRLPNTALSLLKLSESHYSRSGRFRKTGAMARFAHIALFVLGAFLVAGEQPQSSGVGVTNQGQRQRQARQPTDAL